MSGDVFNQSGQKVTYQWNAAGDIHFGEVMSFHQVPTELEKLASEIVRARETGTLGEETAIDAEAKVKKAKFHAQKPDADKKAVLDYLVEAKALLEGVGAAAGLVTAIAQAVEMVKRFIP